MPSKILRLSDEMIRQLDACRSLEELPDHIRAGEFIGPIECRHDESTGWHSIATAAIPKGSIVSHMDGTLSDRAWRYSCQIGSELHVLGPPYINHVCEDPCLYIDAAESKLIALRDIAAGEELTLNYLSFEARMRSPFDCHCGSRRCYGRIEGFDLLGPEQQAELAAELELPDYLRDDALVSRPRGF